MCTPGETTVQAMSRDLTTHMQFDQSFSHLSGWLLRTCLLADGYYNHASACANSVSPIMQVSYGIVSLLDINSFIKRVHAFALKQRDNSNWTP